MRDLLRPILLITALLAIPILPFVALGPPLEREIDVRLRGAASKPVVAAAIVGVLATDVFLPVPSSVVSTLGGRRLGLLGGTLASWLGMTLGAVLGFGLARWCGRPLAERFSSPEQLDRMNALGRRFGPAMLIATRPVPVLAEAAVLFLGTTELAWRRFLPPVVLINFVIALGYSALGDWAYLPAALVLAIAFPLLAATIGGRILHSNPKRKRGNQER